MFETSNYKHKRRLEWLQHLQTYLQLLVRD